VPLNDPLRLKFTVSCQADHAFLMWTERASLWWPVNHTVSQKRDVEVITEPRVGGRVYERTPTGEEIEWGSILAWQPPKRLLYRWHIMSEPRDATEVEVRFTDQGDGTTLVTIEHRGWEAFGLEGPVRRDNNRIGWEGLLPYFVSACASRRSLQLPRRVRTR
jgi:uncharacterized protein YndB with AHSA1/START domain